MSNREGVDLIAAGLLATKLASLNRVKRELDAEIKDLRSRLYDSVGGDWCFDSDLLTVLVRSPSTSCRIVSSHAVPLEFKSLQPDKKLILKHMKATGEVVRGVESTQVWNNVKIQLKGAPLGVKFVQGKIEFESESPGAGDSSGV